MNMDDLFDQIGDRVQDTIRKEYDREFGHTDQGNDQEKDTDDVNEEAPPSAAAEKWIKDNKEKFKKQYGDDWEQVLHATAWKMHNDGSFE